MYLSCRTFYFLRREDAIEWWRSVPQEHREQLPDMRLVSSCRPEIQLRATTVILKASVSQTNQTEVYSDYTVWRMVDEEI